ncbi:hypothetical protein J3R83DRAFT_12092 [Lanmaoa asiatica]|nr:hypothetical protein J3R83DRAFT_12092 [Lanmaoa asiatica]
MTGPFGRELVEKSWERCKVKDWNLSAKCLTSKAARTALDEYLRTHPTLHDEIKNRTGVVYGVEEVPPEDQVTAEVDDDADVPSSAVIRDAFNLQNAEIPAAVDVISHCVNRSEKGPDDTLVAAGDDEDIWRYINFDFD